jgi:hypothetical protein
MNVRNKKGLWTFFFLILGFGANSFASCPDGDILLEKKMEKQAIDAYTACAEDQNDPQAQFFLGKAYQNGQNGLKADLNNALFYYQLSAENGYAPAQVRLAKILSSLMTNNETVILETYQQILKSLEAQELTFEQKNQIADKAVRGLPAYAWLLLAADKKENKWFLPAGESSDDQALSLLKIMEKQISPADKKAAIRQASKWKEKKLLQAAKEVLTEREYLSFYQTLYPTMKKADPKARGQALQYLKQKIQSFLEQYKE